MNKFIISSLFLVLFNFVQAHEGMWIPSLIKMYYPQMQADGLKLTPEQIYSINSSSIKDAVIHFNGGCTAELVSNKGLILTNHHCGFGAIQSHSTVEKDYLKDGFWATDLKSELTNKGMDATRIVRIDDVTAEVLLGLNENMESADYQLKLRENINKILNSATKDNHFEAEVESYDYGNSYYIIVKEVFQDIRLVGAPPTEIGKFGGDTDNWVWPRHTGDFSVFRIYVGKDNKPAEISDDNVPYTPLHYFPVSLLPKHEGDFTMVYGFPGRTEEYISSARLKFIVATERPMRIEMRDKTLSVINTAMKSTDELRIKYAAKQARIANAWKKWKGQLIGLTNIDAVKVKEDYEDSYLEKAGSKSDWKKYGDALTMFSDLQRMYESYDIAYVLLNEYCYYGYGPEFLKVAAILNDLTIAYKNTDAKKQEEAKKKAINKVKSVFKNYDAQVDQNVFESLTPVFLKHMPDEFTPYSFQKGDISKLSEKIFSSSILTDEQKCLDYIEKVAPKVFSKKLMKDAGFLIYQDCDDVFKSKLLKNLRHYYSGMNEQMKVYLAGRFEMFPEIIHWPDANGTLRITWGKLEGSAPRDGMEYKPFTTLDGIYQKYMTGNPDFELSENMQRAIKKKDYGKYAQDGELWTCFTGSNHTTGGNSGSPVIDANGNLIGINFDRSWESTMSDYMFDPNVCRNITVDIRYVLWVIDKYAGATHLVEEMNLVTPEKQIHDQMQLKTNKIKSLTGLIKSNPEDVPSRIKRAQEYVNLGMYKEALADAELCLKSDVKSVDATLIKAISLFHLGELDKSLIEIKKIFRTKKPNVEAMYYRGKIMLAKGEFKKALLDFKGYNSFKPDSKKTYLDMVACYTALGDSKNAAIYLEKSK